MRRARRPTRRTLRRRLLHPSGLRLVHQRPAKAKGAKAESDREGEKTSRISKVEGAVQQRFCGLCSEAKSLATLVKSEPRRMQLPATTSNESKTW